MPRPGGVGWGGDGAAGSSDEERFRALVQCKFRNVRAAHRFDNKWDTGIWKPVKGKAKEHWVYYSSDKVWCKHDLKLDAYGMDQVWCLVTKG